MLDILIMGEMIVEIMRDHEDSPLHEAGIASMEAIILYWRLPS